MNKPTLTVIENVTGFSTTVSFDESQTLWIDPQHSISDPFLAVMQYSLKRGNVAAIEQLLPAYRDDFEALIGLEVLMEVTADISDYPAGTILSVQLDEAFGMGLNGFILPNGYIVESPLEAVTHFTLD